MGCSGTVPDSVFVETLPGLLSKLVLCHQIIQHLALPEKINNTNVDYYYAFTDILINSSSKTKRATI